MDMDHALTVRLPDQVYRAARNMADRRGISINRLVQEAIAEKAEKSVEERLNRAYDMLALDSAEANVESLFAIQAEAANGLP
jgi:predicted DNA-binding ribbon-helix-helix protein